MCGIVGICNLDGAPVEVAILRRMGDLVAHRGPDGEGYHAAESVGLGHRRLSIIDLSPLGHQPMSNETGSVVVVHNGEIYNFQSLRVELEGLGHRFHSQTDTEVIVHGYEEWGEQCVTRFNGMFAFVVWDRARRRLFVARDRFGVKPLYYWTDGRRRFVFASEIKALLAHPDVPRRVSNAALSEYFTFQNILTDRTLFEGVTLLPAGHCLVVELDDPSVPVETEYWDFQFAPDTGSMTREDAVDELYHLFRQAVTRQLVADVPVASYLSGGMDSGSITAVAGQALGRLMTFTCGFDLTSASGLELAFDERANAEALANVLKTEHYEVVLHAGDMESVMPELIWHLEDLRVGQCYPNYYVARLAGKFVKVVLSGAGGDELFGGYPWRYYRGIESNGHHDFYRNYYAFWQRLVPDEDRRRLFVGDVWRDVGGDSPFDVFRQVMATGHVGETLTTKEEFVNASLYFEFKTFLHGLLLVEDKISMAHGLETRVPFLDNDLVDFALRVPPRYKLRQLERPAWPVDENEPAKQRRYELQTGDGKIVLRDAMARIIPSEATTRVKQGFSAPDASWFRGESIDYINGLLRDRGARFGDFLDQRYVVEKLDEHCSGTRNHRLLIWSLLSFEWWLRRFF